MALEPVEGRPGVDDLRSTMIATCCLCVSVTSLFMGLRWWVRGRLSSIGTDDIIITISWICCVGINVISAAATRYGFGVPQAEVDYDDFTTFLKFNTAASTCYTYGMMLAKASFALLYIRLLPKRGLVILNKCILVFLACQGIEESMIIIFPCQPVEKAWDPLMDGSCINVVPVWWCAFVFNLCTDLILFIQPIPSMWSLQLPLAKRIGLIIMMSIGVLNCIISVLRIINAMRIAEDQTFGLAEPMMWSMGELSALIVCSCIPSLRQVASRMPFLNRALGLSSNKMSGYTGQSGSKKKQLSIPLHSRTAADKSRRSKAHASMFQESSPYGTTSHAAAGSPHSDNDSTEEIMKGMGVRITENDQHGRAASQNQHRDARGDSIGGGLGGIVVTHEVVRDVEENTASTGTSSTGKALAMRRQRSFEDVDGAKPAEGKSIT